MCIISLSFSFHFISFHFYFSIAQTDFFIAVICRAKQTNQPTMTITHSHQKQLKERGKNSSLVEVVE